MKASQRRRLKQDRYVETVTRALAWVRRNQKPVLIAVAIVIFVAASIIWFWVSHRAAEAVARELLTDAEAKAQMALLEKADLQPKAVDDAVSRCEMIAADYPRSAAAPLALLQAADLLALSGRAQEAVPYFERVLKLAGDSPGVAALARRGLAQALEESGNLREAIAQYRVFIADEASPAAVQASWDAGRCHETLGETELAVEFYRKAADYGGESTWAKLARSRLRDLLGKKPSPSAGAPQAPAAVAGKGKPSLSEQKP